MRKLKSIFITILTVVIFVVLCLCGCGNNKTIVLRLKVPQSLTMNCIAASDVKDAEDFLTKAKEDFEKNYNKKVVIEIETFLSGKEKEAITDTFGTKDAADILYDDFFNMSSYIHTGNVVPLDGILSAEIKSDLSEGYLDFGKYGGRQYMMPYSARQNVMVFNKELMYECGLSEYCDGQNAKILSWDIETWNYILNTLAEKLPRGKYPMMMYAANNQGDTHIMSFLRSQGSVIYDAEGNFDLTSDSATAALKWIQDGVETGWYMPHPETKSMNDNSDKQKSDELVFYNFNLSSSIYRKMITSPQKYGLVNYPGNVATLFCNGFEVFDNGDVEKVEVAKDFVNYIFESEELMEYSAGEIPVSQRVAEKYKDKIFLYDEWHNNYVNVVDFNLNHPNWQGRSDSVRSVFYVEIAKLLKKKATGEFTVTPEECAVNLNKVLNAAITYGRVHSNPHR